MGSELSDADLARQIASGADAADAELVLYRRFAARIELYGRRHLGGDRAAREDLVQQVLLVVLQAIRSGRLQNPDGLASFVLGTCRHVTWDMHRAEERQRRIERATEAVAPPAIPPYERGEDIARLFRCIGALLEREALAVRMSFMEDRPVEEIAARLGVSSGNLRVIRHRALAKLTRCMAGEDRSPGEGAS